MIDEDEIDNTDTDANDLKGEPLPRYRNDGKRCKTCYRPIARYGAKKKGRGYQCEACATRVYRTLHETMVEYNRRNPDDHLTYKQVHSLTTGLMEKLRHRIKNPEFNQGEGAVLNELWKEVQ